ncbi:hypothetical protein KY289_005551 [Solanum tuberosum]|nr:hypothetical protein KY289_005551 [Solanum tuberosum]
MGCPAHDCDRSYAARGVENARNVLEAFISEFFGTVGENAHEFLTTYREWLHTLDLVESRGAFFTTYQLDGPARQWWHTFIETRPTGSPLVTWTEFSKAFLDRFILCNVRDHLRGSDLQDGEGIYDSV